MFLFKEVRYKDILYVDHLYLKKNRITSIVGESGSGKTTLLRLLNKLISKDSGKIFYLNKKIEEWDSIEIRKKNIMLPQQSIVFPGNIKDNLVVGFKFSKEDSPNDEKLQLVLKNVNLKKKLEDLPETLSGGEKQRLAIARVLLMHPDLYLLDEPSSSLDKKTELSIIKLVCDIVKAENKSLIMVTHSIDVAKKFSDEIVELKDGEIFKITEIKK